MPRKQSSHSSSKLSSFPSPVRKSSSREEDELDERETEDLLSLSPQPSIISTVTHGATNKNSIKFSSSSSSSSSKDQNNNNNNNNKRERSKERVSSTERPELRISSPPSGLNFGDVLFRSRSSSKSSSQETTGYGSRKSDDTDTQREGKKLTPINSSRIELDLIDNYPGVPKVLPSSYRYVNMSFSLTK